MVCDDLFPIVVLPQLSTGGDTPAPQEFAPAPQEAILAGGEALELAHDLAKMVLFVCRAVVDFQDQMHMVRHDDKTINIDFGIVFRQSLDQTLYRQPKLIQNAVLADDGPKQTLVFKNLKSDEEPPEAVVDLTVSKLWPTIFAINHRHCKSPSSWGARASPLAQFPHVHLIH